MIPTGRSFHLGYGMSEITEIIFMFESAIVLELPDVSAIPSLMRKKKAKKKNLKRCENFLEVLS